jgi:hypothetical protein
MSELSICHSNNLSNYKKIAAKQIRVHNFINSSQNLNTFLSKLAKATNKQFKYECDFSGSSTIYTSNWRIRRVRHPIWTIYICIKN